MPLWLQKLLALSAMAALICAASWKAGSDAAQKKGDIEKAKVEAVAAKEKQDNARNLAELKAQFKKELDHETDAAYKRALRDALNSWGLLPGGSSVRKSSAGGGEAVVSEGADVPSCEPGLAERIEAFAADCVRDARRVEMCTQWAIREGLPVE